MTLRMRLSAVIALLSLLSIGIGMLGLFGMNHANEGLKSVYENRTVALEQVSRVDRLVVQNQLALAEALQDSMEATIKIKSALIAKNTAEIDQTWAVYMTSALGVHERQLAEKFASARARMFKKGLFPAVAAMNEGKLADASQLQDQLQALVPAVRTSVDALRKLQVDEAKKEYEQSSARFVTLRATVVLAIALGALIAALSGFLLVRNIYRQLGGEPEYAARIVRSIAAGDLTITVATAHGDHQSLLFAMKTMQQNLVQTVGDIKRSTDMIATATSQIAAGNLDLSSRTEQQAGSLETTASAIQELATTVKHNAAHAHHANQLVLSASEVALKGGTVVSQVVATMASINASARKIVDIIGVIDSIAFQTNILALNAAVEAARAGEQGRGFAVVASEVRTLAQRSAGAAKQIKELIGDSVDRAETGSTLVEQAGATMEQIVARVRQVTEIMGEITVASGAQHAGIEQVNQAIGQMDRATRQNAVLVKEGAAAADALHNQAGNLARVVSLFKLDVEPSGELCNARVMQHATRTCNVSPVRTIVTAVQYKRVANSGRVQASC
jgi:methyl-accepting chemotaxis protein